MMKVESLFIYLKPTFFLAGTLLRSAAFVPSSVRSRSPLVSYGRSFRPVCHLSLKEMATTREDVKSGAWEQVNFSITISPRDSRTSVTHALHNRIQPSIQEVAAGVGFVQILSTAATIEIGQEDEKDCVDNSTNSHISNTRSSSSSCLSLAISHGRLQLGSNQEVYLYSSSTAPSTSATTSLDSCRSGEGSVRFDFIFIWTSSPVTEEQPVSNHAQTNGHVVGQLRPLVENSVEREAAIDAALVELGFDPVELRTAEEFFGSSALKTYHSFVRPRPATAVKMAAQETVERGAARHAHQIGHLIRSHRADRAEYLRNRDRAVEDHARQVSASPPHPITLVLDNIRSAYNVGGMFRTADTVRAAEVITCGLTPHPNGPGFDKLKKTAFDSLDTVASRHFNSTIAAVRALKEEGYRVLAMETTENAENLYETDLFPLNASGVRQPVAFLMGNEVTGVDTSVMQLCDGVVELPVYGLKNSLNVCSAATAAGYEALRQWTAVKKIPIKSVSTSRSIEVQENGESDSGSEISTEELHALQRGSAVDMVELEDYAIRHSEQEPELLQKLREETANVFPQARHMVSGPLQGRLLKALTIATGAKRVLEIGTFTGYSALCFAEGGADVVTCELDPRAIEVARQFFDRSGFGAKIEVMEGQAMTSIESLAATNSEPFDIIFLDGDKRTYTDYYNKVLDLGLLRPGGVLLADNVLFKGIVSSMEAGVVPEEVAGDGKQAKRRRRIADALHSFNTHVNDDERTVAVLLPLRDGLTMAVRKVL